MVRRNLSEATKKACDKMFIPPNMSDSINRAVHAVSTGTPDLAD
jgi:hypothetical protein